MCPIVRAACDPSPERLCSAEVCAAVLDGHIRRLGPGWLPIDEPETPEARAAALLPPQSPLVLARASAHWVYTGWRAPEVIDACAPNRCGWGVLPDTPVHVREVLLPDRDLLALGPIACTTPLRTGFDLARDPDLSAAEAHGFLTTLAALDTTLVARIVTRIRHHPKLPNRVLALRRLAALS